MKLAAVLLCSAVGALGQSPSATLLGVVLDATGAPVPAAALILRNTATNLERRAESGVRGEFALPGLAPGEYQLAVEKQGFQRVEDKGIVLQVDQTLRLELRLEVGAVTQSVEVTAPLPPLNTENAGKGDVIVRQEMAEMPLEGRNFEDLAFLVPGVARKGQSGQGSGMSINGARADNTNFYMDGFNNRSSFNGAAQVSPPLDAIEEFKMQTSGYSAEYGQLAGGVMNVVLRSGGNRPHGTLSEYLRNDAFDARNFFDSNKSKLRRNQFGAVLSGPVVLPRLYRGFDRTFFLFGWEGLRQSAGRTAVGRVPTGLERRGDFSETRDARGAIVLLTDPLAGGACTVQVRTGCFPNNRIPAARIHPVSAKAVAWYPSPNREGTNNYLANANANTTWDNISVKGDHHAGRALTLSGRLLRRGSRVTNPFAGSDLGTFGNSQNGVQSLSGVSATYVFTPTLLSEMRAGLSRIDRVDVNDITGRDSAAELGLPGVTGDPRLAGFPRFEPIGMLPLGDFRNTPLPITVNNYQFSGSLTAVRSRHIVKFGGEVVRTQFYAQTSTNARGRFVFQGRATNDAFGDFLIGMPQTSQRQVASNKIYFLNTNAGLYLQDDIRVTNSLTLNLGLRYELLLPVHEKYGRLTNFLPESGQVAVADDRTVPNLEQAAAAVGLAGRLVPARQAGLPAPLVFTDRNNLAPRVGFAWRPLAGNRMVVRSGYGIFYGGSITNTVRTDMAEVFPFVVNESYSRVAAQPELLTLSNPFPDSRAVFDGVNTASGFDVYAPTSYLQSWHFTIERQLGRGSAVEAAYAGSKGTNLGRRYDLNQPVRTGSAAGVRPYPAFGSVLYYSFGSNSTYSSAMFTLRKRFASGLFYRLNYTFSKSIDDASQLSASAAGGYRFGAQDSRNLKAERGRSDWDTGHAVTMSFAWQPPLTGRLLKGWQLAGSGRAYTGQPFTPIVGQSDANLGEANRPDRIAKGTVDNPSPERWFDVAAFPPVARGSFRFGNSGRNILDGPGFVAMNASLSRRFTLREHVGLQFRWEVFNITNHANFELPVNVVDQRNAGIIAGADPGRLMQFAVKVQF